jgi:N-acetylglucosaminyldiphosphoundecaprenol N-acetyl-beta-D-mannosaminyltransferase
MKIEIANLAGLRIHEVTAKVLLQYIHSQISEKRKALILHLNIHGACLAFQLPWLKQFYNEAHMVFCDGNGVRWGLGILGERIPPKIPITRWVWDLAAFCERNGLKLFLLGSAPCTVTKAAENMKAKYPQLKLAGFHDGYFEKRGPENEKIIALVNEAQPDILVVGFGMPHQEKWIQDNWKKLNVAVFLPGGGVLDYAAGRLGRAPEWMLKLHLEWLFRVVQEPKRLLKRYVTEIPYFFAVIFAERLKRIILRRSQKELPESSSGRS